jgi:hypothetical protein
VRSCAETVGERAPENMRPCTFREQRCRSAVMISRAILGLGIAEIFYCIGNNVTNYTSAS